MTNIPELLRSHGLHPRKAMGQNFLVDAAALQRIVAAAELAADDAVVEIGAGVGTLTRLLAEQAGRVLAVELDRGLAAILHEQMAGLDNVEILQADILQVADLGLPPHSYKVVANLPYYITSAVLRHLLSGQAPPRMMVVTVQREVAERIVAGPGEMSLLAVSVQFYGRPRIVAQIPAGAFYPRPQVDSAVVRIDVYDSPGAGLGPVEEAAFFRVARAGFSQRRKMLRNSLAGGLGLAPAAVEARLAEAGVAPQRRAETLSLEDWAAVTCALSGVRPGGSTKTSEVLDISEG